MKKIQVEFKIDGSIVRARIIEQSDGLRGIETVFTDSTGFRIRSSSNPELSLNHFYIRGSNTSADDRETILNCSTNEAAIAYCKRVVSALKEWRESL